MPHYINDGVTEEVFKAMSAAANSYERTGELSTTSCIDSPRVRVLTERHSHEIGIGITDTLPMFVGTACHAALTGTETEGAIKEREFVIEVGGIKFSGRPDIFYINEKKLIDYKFTGVFSYLYNKEGKPEHQAQANINAFLLEQYGYIVEQAVVEMFFLDWKRASFGREKDYPPRIVQIPIQLWGSEKTAAYIKQRVALHLLANDLKDEELPLCSDQERWAKPRVFVVKKKGNKRAITGGTFGTYDEAVERVKEVGSARSHEIEERVGGYTRCKDYCQVKHWCNQYKEEEAPNQS